LKKYKTPENRMKNLFFCLLSGVLVFSASCENDKNTSMKFHYPMNPGNNWTYTQSNTVDFGDSTYKLIVEYSEECLEPVKLKNGVKALPCKISSSMYGASYQYYTNDSSGLKIHAYSMGNDVMAKKKIQMPLQQVLRKSIPVPFGINTDFDTLYYANPPMLSLAYPLEIGNSWTYNSFSLSGADISIIKRVAGIETVSVPAGDFRCFKMEYKYQGSGAFDEMEMTDYYCNKGLVKRVTQSDNLRFMDETDKEVFKASLTTELMLTGYDLE
jgi:hypothetical protein